MKFSSIPQLSYDRNLLSGDTISDLLSKPIDKYPLAGLSDLREILLITIEFYRNQPVLTVKEKDAGTVDKVFLEKVGRDSFSRALEMPVYVEQSLPDTRRERYGEVTLRPTVLSFAIAVLAQQNYYPVAGDQVTWLNQLLEITRVYVDPRDYFHQTGFPLYIRCDTRVANYDSRDLGGHCASPSDGGLTSAGAPSPVSPDGNSPSGTLFRYDEPINNGPLPLLISP